MTLPDRVRQALADRGEPNPQSTHRSIARGNIRQIDATETGAGDRRLVLVLRVDSEREAAEIMLVHPYVELATHLDVIAPPSTATPYSVVIETDVRGVAWLAQLGRFVGALTGETMDAIGLIALGQSPSAPSVMRGQHLAGPLEPRWAFKVDEGRRLRELSADCTEHLLEDASPWALDPGLFILEKLQSAPNCAAVLLELVDVIASKKIEFGYEDLDLLDTFGALDAEQWVEAFGIEGLDFYRALIVPVIEEALVRMPTDERDRQRAAPGDFAMPRRRADAGPITVRPDTRLITASYLWLDELEDSQTVRVAVERGLTLSLVAVGAGAAD